MGSSCSSLSVNNCTRCICNWCVEIENAYCFNRLDFNLSSGLLNCRGNISSFDCSGGSPDYFYGNSALYLFFFIIVVAFIVFFMLLIKYGLIGGAFYLAVSALFGFVQLLFGPQSEPVNNNNNTNNNNNNNNYDDDRVPLFVSSSSGGGGGGGGVDATVMPVSVVVVVPRAITTVLPADAREIEMRYRNYTLLGNESDKL